MMKESNMSLRRDLAAFAGLHPIVTTLVVASLIWGGLGVVLCGKFIYDHGRLPWGEAEIVTYFLGGAP